jgi:hypothetical protein
VCEFRLIHLVHQLFDLIGPHRHTHQHTGLQRGTRQHDPKPSE